MDDSNGNTQTGNVQDTYFFDYVPDNSDDDSNNLPYDDYLDNNDNNNSSNNCTSHNSYKCYNGSVYWYDSCNKVEELKEACVSGEECLFGTCIEDNDPPNPPVVPVLPSCGNNILEEKEYCDGIELAGETCASFGFSLGTLACNAYCTFDISGCYNPGDSSEDSENDSECVLTSFYACNQGDVYWYDSCGNPSQVKEYCSSSQVCNQNQCEEDNGGYSLPPPPQIPNIPS